MALYTLSVVLFFFFAITHAQNAVVDLGYARYRGQRNSNGVSEWLGIRYAAPPVGNLRFSAPREPRKMDGVQYASRHGALCIPTGKYPMPNNTAEDCLFLDVYAPAKSEKSKLLPVFVWIQGGGFNENSQYNYNGTGLIKASDMGIVVVTFNYRVGPYGFLSGEEVVEGGSVNNGLKDQIMVLKWVQKHISKFGGDPDHVVVGGASAGAASVTLLLSAYGGRDDHLFHAAVAESQSFAGMLRLNESQFAYNNLVIRTGCASYDDTLACLRNLDINSLQRENINTPLPTAQAPPLYLYGPTIDDELVPDYTYRLFRKGKFIKVPVIFGDVTDEGTSFVPRNISDVGDADTFIQSQFNEIQLEHLARINEWYLQENQTQQYPGAGPYWKPTSTAYGEIRYTCPGVDVSSIFAKAGVPSWNYHYAVLDPALEASGDGTPHIAERFAIFGLENVSDKDKVPASYYTTNAPIIPVVQGYWTSFIKSFDPNPHRYAGTPKWKTWGQNEGYRRIFLRTGETRMESVPMVQRDRCEYLVSIGTELGQ
ncbi:hypothetical protein FE257_007713 [Aspergillus nanangensis]|uniref:Carboxylic ester hydrolase n=1 Tax=Aspergillus nanangensis TaxID=2582783 RepID=A0AAD4CWV6_ASPNN|nr:hypothetical protein FE257_007713 [Aspergillus nanangensis]